MDKWEGRVALVTGASSGIGAVITRKFVEYGLKVVGCARNVEKIKVLQSELSTAKGQLIPVKCDLRNEQDILSMFAMIEKECGGVDICVNNAGLAHPAPLLTRLTSDWLEMVQVNIMAVAICTREAVKQMREKGTDDGHVFLINSMAGHRIKKVSITNFYSATKFAMTAINEGLRNELKDIKSNIRVTSISPGRVDTEFIQRMLKGEEKHKDFFTGIKSLTADDVSDAVIYALKTPAHVEVNDILIRPTEQSY